MATLLPSLSSDEEDNVTKLVSKKESKRNKKGGNSGKLPNEDESVSSEEEVDEEFEFGGLLDEDHFNDCTSQVGSGSALLSLPENGQTGAWSYRKTLEMLEKQQDGKGDGVNQEERTHVASIIAAVRKNILKQRLASSTMPNISAGDEKQNDVEKDIESSDDESIESTSDNDESENDESEDDESEVDDVDSVDEEMDEDIVKERLTGRAQRERRNQQKLTEKNNQSNNEEKDQSDTSDETDSAGEEELDDSEDEENEEEKAEAVKAAAFFEDDNMNDGEYPQKIEMFSQLNLSRPLLRGVASMGFVSPTSIQARVIPLALAGRDICASAVTGSGKTAAFLLPVMERILQRHVGSKNASSTHCLILTPTRELAAQCVSMAMSIAQFTKLRSALVVGGTKNINAQAAELRTRPDFVVGTPGRILDHLTNSPGVDFDDLEFLILDEADRLLDLGFQEEVHEIVKACPCERQTLLFSATMSTNVDELIKLSLKRPMRIRVTDKNKKRNDAADSSVEVASRLEQEFVRVRSGNDGINREAMVLALLTRSFSKRVIVFFDTKADAHRLMIICGLSGIKCAELHGNLTQTQRLEALEAFREGDVDVLLATDLAARGLDISSVEVVINFEMPLNVNTYVHRIGRTARIGRQGKACTLISESRRQLMKEVMKDAEQKRRKTIISNHGKMKDIDTSTGLIRSRTIPPAVVHHFVAKIKSLEEKIKEVQQAEMVAKLDRIAEMEATKAKNMIEHRNEILSKPQKEWFASSKQKISSQDAYRLKQEEISAKIGTGKHRMTRKKRRLREAKEDLMRHQEDLMDHDEDKGVRLKNMASEKSQKSSARASKKAAARNEKRKDEQSHFDDDVERQRRLRETERKKRKNAFSSDSLGDGGLFEDENITYQKKQKDHEESRPKTSFEFTEFDPNKKMRKGGKRGTNRFKSKSKYRRR